MPRRHSWRQSLQDLVQLSETVISAGNVSELYGQLTSRIAQTLGARACLIALYDRINRSFMPQRPYYGLRQPDPSPVEYKVTPEYHRAWNFRLQGPLISNNPLRDPRIHPEFVRKYSVKSMILAPILIKQEMLGAIAIMNKPKGFTEFDRYLASMVASQTAIVLKNVQLMDEEKRRAEQISLLNETARQLNSSLLLDEILDRAIAAIQKTLRVQEAAIYMPSPEEHLLEMKVAAGSFHRHIKEQGYMPSSNTGFLGYAYHHCKTIYSNDCALHPVFIGHPMIPSKSEAAIPVQREGKVLAILNVHSAHTDAFSASDILTLETLSDQLAIAFHNSMLYENERKHNDQMLLLSEIISELALIVDRDAIVQTTVERIKQRFHYYFVAMAWVDRQHQVLKDWYYLPKFETLSQSLPEQVPLSKGLSGKAARTGKSALVGNTAKSEDYYNVLEEVRSELDVPVKIGDTVVAVLNLQSDRLNAFDDSDVLIMETLAHALSTALQNADSYQQLIGINEQLAETARMKDEIVQIVAHDFRSPLTVIRGYLDYLLKKQEWTNDRQKEIMETVSLQAQHLQKLAEATLKASRLDMDDIPFSFEKVQFSALMRRFIFPWSEKHTFALKSGKDLPLIQADAGRLQEVLENLVSNAIKYSPDGGCIELEAFAATAKELPEEFAPAGHDAFLVVRVSDEGVGIPPEKRNLLFQRFTRLHDNRRIEGIGLGLYIAKKMIEHHGGRIWLEEKAKGSRFCFAIPAFFDPGLRPNILVVDDDVHTLRLMHRGLSDLGVDVLTAGDANEAVEKIRAFRPRLIVLDVLASAAGQPDLWTLMNAGGPNFDVSIVIFTGKSDYRPPAGLEAVPVISKSSGIEALRDFIRSKI